MNETQTTEETTTPFAPRRYFDADGEITREARLLMEILAALQRVEIALLSR